MTDRTHPDSGRIITSGDVIAELQDRIAELESQLAAQPAPSGDAELQRCKQVCAATSECWRADAESWKAERDSLLEALKGLVGGSNKRFSGGKWDRARAAIKAMEEKP
jgi:hypothetical protein